MQSADVLYYTIRAITLTHLYSHRDTVLVRGVFETIKNIIKTNRIFTPLVFDVPPLARWDNIIVFLFCAIIIMSEIIFTFHEVFHDAEGL